MSPNKLIPQLHDLLTSFLGTATKIEMEYHTAKDDIVSINFGEDWRVNVSDIFLDELFQLLGRSNISFVYDKNALDVVREGGELGAPRVTIQFEKTIHSPSYFVIEL